MTDSNEGRSRNTSQEGSTDASTPSASTSASSLRQEQNTTSSPGTAEAVDEQTAAAESPDHAPSGGNSSGEDAADDGHADEQTAQSLSEREVWMHTSRATVLFGLLGMALVNWIRLSRSAELTYDLVRKNAMPMPERDMFLLQILGAGAGFALVALCFCLFWQKTPAFPRRLEHWGWFLSPLLLLPAIPVMGSVDAWKGRHEDLLPLVLFLAILTEFFVSMALRHVPPELREDKTTDLHWKLREDDTGGFFRRPFFKKNAWLLIALGGALFYVIFMSYFTVRWHNRLGTATFDLGINNNLIYGGLHGKFNQSTVIFPDEPQKYLANHLKAGLYIFLPIYALHPKAETLLIIQSASLGLGAIPIFLFARKRIPEWAACILAFAYLAFYPMHGANFYEMKMVPTSAAFVLTTIWAVDSKRWITTGIFFVLTLIMREDLPIPLAVLGGFLLLSGHRPRAGALICGVSIFWFVLIRFKVMIDAGAWWFPNMYEELWAKPETGFRSVLKTLVSNPTFVLKHIFIEEKFWYLMHLLVPMAFLPARRWYLWAAFVPGAILTLLVTDYDPPVMFSFQYVMHWSPYLFLACALSLASIARHPLQGPSKAAGAVVAVAVASGALSYNYGAFPLRDRHLEAGYHKIKFGWGKREREQLAHVRELTKKIPQDASVATTERIGAHLSSRVHFYTLRRGTEGAEYLVARRSGLRLGRTKSVLTKALKSEEYGVIGRYGDFVLFKKGAETSKNQEILEEWHLVSSSDRGAYRRARRKRRERDKDHDKDRDKDHDKDRDKDKNGDNSDGSDNKARDNGATSGDQDTKPTADQGVKNKDKNAKKRDDDSRMRTSPREKTQ